MISARLQRFLVSALLAVAVIAVYAPVAGYDFIALDDAGYVEANQNINGGFSWDGIKWTLVSSVDGNWHPVTMLSHMADCQVYGLDAGGHHFTNLLFHLANTLLLFWILLAITKNQNPKVASQKSEVKNQKSGLRHSTSDLRPPASNLWPCALVATLFGLHPLHVESVAWIAERKDVLSAFFFMLTLWAYMRFAADSKKNQKSKFFYALALLFFSLGLMSKPMLVTVPFVLLLLDYWPLKRIPNLKFQISNVAPLLLEKIPFFLLTVVFSVVTLLIQKSYGAVVQLEYFPLKARLANAMISYAEYLGKIFWPHPLAMLYPYRQWTSGEIEISTALFAGISLAAVWLGRRKPYVFVGWFWFAVMLVPVIGLVQVGIQATADRYTYLPSIGIFIVLAWCLAEFATSAAQRALAVPGAILAVALLIPVTAIQVRYWKNTETLFGHAVRVTGNNTQAHYILGALYESHGKTSEAQTEFEQSIRDDPDNIKALSGLGYILCCQGKFDEAAQAYQTALRIEPDSAKAHFGLAEVLRKQHNDDEAINEYLLALKSEPNLAEAHYQLAALYSDKNDPATAIDQLRKTVDLSPGWFLPLNNLAWMLATQSDPKLRNGHEAMQLAIRAVIIVGRNNPNALDTLAAAYAETGRFQDAVTTAQSAVQNASAVGQTNLANEINSRLKLYQSHRAWRE